MNKTLKYLLTGFITLVVLVIVLMTYFAITFNPNDYKQQIIHLVKEKKQRELVIEGDIKLSFWPKLGADLGKVSLSAYQSDQAFASIDSAKVALAVLPLLKNALVIDTIYIDGAKAKIVQHPDGTTNYDDLLSDDESESSAIQFDVQGIKITNSELTFVDESKDATYHIGQFNLSTSQISLGQPIELDSSFSVKANQPMIDAKTAFKGTFFIDAEHKRFSVKGLESNINGALLDGKQVRITASGDIDAQTESMTFLIDGLTLSASGDVNGVKQTVDLSAPSINIEQDKVSSKAITLSLGQTQRTGDLKVNMVLANMEGTPTLIQSAGIKGELAMHQGKRTVNATFSSPFKGNIEHLIVDLPKLIGQLAIKDPSLPNGAVNGTFSLGLHADIKKEAASSTFNIVLAETKLNGDIALASFKQPNIQFNLTADQLDFNKLLGAPTASTNTSKPADLTALASLLLNGKIKIGSMVYDQYHITGLNLAVKADGNKVATHDLDVKINDSQIKGTLALSQFAKPFYTFDLDINQLNLNEYIRDAPTETKTTGNEWIDLGALQALNANGSLGIAKLNYGKTMLSNVRLILKADGGVAKLAPFSARLYGGSMNGSLNVDARKTPHITFKQTMNKVNVNPLLSDTINNDMLSGVGTVNIDISTQGNTVNAFKKSLAGTASLAITDGALKGIDIAKQIRVIKSKVNMLKGNGAEIAANQTQKTDFSELTANFTIKDGIAHNADLSMKAPILRLAKGDSFGDINIGNETLNYTATPRIVKSIKGQGGEDLNQLAGIAIPLKISGTFTNPKFELDTKAIITGLAKSKLLEKIGGDKGLAVQELMGGDNQLDAIKRLLGKKPKTSAKTTAPSATDASNTEAADKPKTIEDLAKDKLKGFLKF